MNEDPIAAEPAPSEFASPDLMFEELFAKEHAGLFRALYLITGSSQDAEELMQDAFLKVWERWEGAGNHTEDTLGDSVES